MFTLEKKSQVNNLSFHFNKLEKEEKINQKKQNEENNKKQKLIKWKAGKNRGKKSQNQKLLL